MIMEKLYTMTTVLEELENEKVLTNLDTPNYNSLCIEIGEKPYIKLPLNMEVNQELKAKLDELYYAYSYDDTFSPINIEVKLHLSNDNEISENDVRLCVFGISYDALASKLSVEKLNELALNPMNSISSFNSTQRELLEDEYLIFETLNYYSVKLTEGSKSLIQKVVNEVINEM